MRYRFPGLALVLFVGLAALLALPTGAAEPVDAKKVEKLIEKLGSDDFSDRDKASAELDALGLPVLPALRKAAESKDVEVSRRATDLVARIEKRTENVRLLAPKKVHLVYKDTPVAEAIADFSKKSGYPIQVQDPEGKLKDRKISLDTGEVTFWQAFEMFCDKAGLTEMDPTQGFAVPGIRPVPLPIRRVPLNVPPAPPAQPEKEQPQPRGNAPRGALDRGVPSTAFGEAPPKAEQAPPAAPPAIARPAIAPVQIVGAPVPFGPGGFGPWNPFAPNQLILVDGKQKAMPADAAGAIRVRVMEKADMFGPANDKEILIGLKVTAEPKIQIQQLTGVKVEKAVDDQGQSLAQAMINAPADPNVPVALPAIARVPAFFGGANQYTMVRLKKAEKPSKELKELTGVISAQILAPATPVITVDKIMDAAGKETKGAEGGRLKIVEVTKGANGQITVKFELEQPPNLVPAMPFGPIGVPLMPNPFPLPKGVLPVPPAPAVPPGAPGAGFRAEPPAAPPVVAAPVQIQIEVQPGVIIVGPGGVGGPVAFGNTGNGVTLEDDKGNTIPVVGQNAGFRRDGRVLVREDVMIFQPAKDQTPAKLVFSGSKSVVVEIPFTLKNVTLP